MERSAEPKEFQLPLELQFSMRKAQLTAQEMTWDQLYYALINLYHQRLMEWQAVKQILSAEDIQIDFDIPTEVELEKLAACFEDDDEEDDEDDYVSAPF